MKQQQELRDRWASEDLFMHLDDVDALRAHEDACRFSSDVLHGDAQFFLERRRACWAKAAARITAENFARADFERAALLAQSGTSQGNFMHQLCGRGNLTCVRRILTVYDQGGFPKLNREFMLTLLNQTTREGKGCVDAALNNKTAIAKLLKSFGAEEQRAPPVRVSDQVQAEPAAGTPNPWSWDNYSPSASGQVASSSSGNTWGGSRQQASTWGQGEWKSSWGSSSWKGGKPHRRRQPQGASQPGEYDHRGLEAESRGMGQYAHDRRNKRYEDEMDEVLSSESENSQPDPIACRQPHYKER